MAASKERLWHQPGCPPWPQAACLLRWPATGGEGPRCRPRVGAVAAVAAAARVTIRAGGAASGFEHTPLLPQCCRWLTDHHTTVCYSVPQGGSAEEKKAWNSSNE